MTTNTAERSGSPGGFMPPPTNVDDGQFPPPQHTVTTQTKYYYSSQANQQSGSSYSSISAMALMAGVISVILWPFYLVYRFFIMLWEAALVLWDVLGFLFTYSPFILTFGFLAFGGFLLYNQYDVIGAELEHYQRCYGYPAWVKLIDPFFSAARDIYDNLVCWTNMTGQLNRTLSIRLILETLHDCRASNFDIYDWLRAIGNLLKYIIIITFQWAFSFNPFENQMPLRPASHILFDDLIPMTARGIICLCQDLQLPMLMASRIFSTQSATLNQQVNPLVCAAHQLANAVIGYYQALVRWAFNILGLIRIVVIGGGTPADIKDILTGVVPGDPVVRELTSTTMVERLNAAAFYLGAFLDNVFAIGYCSAVAEIDASGVDDDAPPLYDALMLDPANRPTLFCVIGPAVSALNRILRLTTHLTWHVPQILYESYNQVPGPRYLVHKWYLIEWRNVMATIGNRGDDYDYSTSLNFPTPIPNPNPFPLNYPNDYLYGPDVVLKDCDNYNNSWLSVPCLQCSLVANQTAQECLCNTAASLDAITTTFVNATIWAPTLCCGIPRLGRTAAAILDFGIGAAVYLFNKDGFADFLADQNYYDRIFDELVGRPYQMSGVLDCVNQMAIGLDPRMEGLSRLITTVLKAIAESIRLAIIAGVRLINTVQGLPNGFGAYVCITDPNNCMDLERSLSWLRKPRLHFVWDPTYAYTIINPIATPAFIDWVCYWLDFEVLTSFMASPPPALPDFCCTVNFLFRLFVELGKFAAKLLLGVVQVFAIIFDPLAPATSNIFTAYLGCSSLDTCNNFAEIVSDAQDLGFCPCEFITDVETIAFPADGNQFFCICDILNPAAFSLVNTLRAAAVFFSNAWEGIYCLGSGWNTPECTTDLQARSNAGFADVNIALDNVAAVGGGFGCLFGIPWLGLRIDCQGTAYTSPMDYPDCDTSLNSFGPGQIPCTMADRMNRVFFYGFQGVVSILRYIIGNIQKVIDLGLNLLSPVPLENTSSSAIVEFLIDVAIPLWGLSNKVLIIDGANSTTIYNTSVPSQLNTTKMLDSVLDALGYNKTAFYLFNPNCTANPFPCVANLTGYQQAAPGTQFGHNFTFTTNPNITETTGLGQAMGILFNCLLGPPTTSCLGPLLFTQSVVTGFGTGCFGDILIIVFNMTRDVWSQFIVLADDIMTLIGCLFNADFGCVASQFLNIIVDLFNLMGAIAGSVLGVIGAFLLMIDGITAFLYGPLYQIMYRFFKDVIATTIMIYEAFVYIGYILTGVGIGGKRSFSGLAGDVMITETVSDHINGMTDNTWCKNALLHLMDYESISASDELLFRGCYYASLLPSVFLDKSGGDLNLPNDTFYNPETFFPLLISWTEMMGQYMDVRSAPLIPSPVTEVLTVPDDIMSYAQAQVALQEIEAGITQEELDYFSEALGIFNLTVHQLLEYALNEIEDYDATHKRFREDGGDDGNLSVLDLWKLLRPKAKRGVNTCRMTINDGIDCFDDGDADDSSQVVFSNSINRGLIDTSKYYNIFTVTLDDIGGRVGGLQRKKRGWGDSLTGTSLEDNIAFDGNVSGVAYDPFHRTNINIFTSIRGGIALNLTTINRIVPVVDGKIAVTYSNTTFWDFMKLKSWNNSLNIFTIKLYEKTEVNVTQEQYIKMGAKGDYFTHLLGQGYSESPVGVFDNYEYDGEDHQNPSQRKRSEDHTDEELRKRFGKPPHGESHKEWAAIKKNILRRHKVSTADLVKFIKTAKTSPLISILFDPETTGQGGGGREMLYPWSSGSYFEETSKTWLRASSGGGWETYRGIRNFAKETWEKYNNPSASSTLYVDSSSLYTGVEDILSRNQPRKRTHEAVTDFRLLSHMIKQAELESRRLNHAEVVEKAQQDKRGYLAQYVQTVLPTTWLHFVKSVGSYFDPPYYNPSNSSSGSKSALKPNTMVRIYDETDGSLVEDAVGSIWDDLTRVKDSTGYVYGAKDEVYAVHDGFGGVKTYKVLKLSPKTFMGESLLVNVPSQPLLDDFLGSDMGAKEHFLDARDVLHRYNEGAAKKKRYDSIESQSTDKRLWDSAGATFDLGLNYHELHYGSHETRKPCLDGVMWSEYWVFSLSRPLDNPLIFASLEELQAHHYQHRTTTAVVNNTNNLSPTSPEEVVVEIKKCYRKNTSRSPLHPHRLQYGHILGEESLYSHRYDMLMGVWSDIFSSVSEKLSWSSMRHSFKEKVVDPYLTKYRDTLKKTGKPTRLTSPLVAYEAARQKLFGEDSTTYKIPDLFWVELGHSLIFYDDEGRQRPSSNQEGLLEAWREEKWEEFVGRPYYNISKSRVDSEIRKRMATAFPPLLNICLPSTLNETTCNNCSGCTIQNDFEEQNCYRCGLCANCTLGFGGFYDCTNCGACQLGGPYCTGGCYECGGCVTGSKCLDCVLVQTILTSIVDDVFFCVEWKLNNNTAVIITPAPGVEFINVSELPPNYAPPKFTGGFAGIFSFLFDYTRYLINKLVGFDLYQTIVNFLTTTNTDWQTGPIGLLFSTTLSQIPFIGRCDRNTNLMCTFGFGLEKALIITAIIFLFLSVASFLRFGPAGLLLTLITPATFFYVVGLLAWLWNPICMNHAAFGLLGIFGLDLLVFPEFPVCAADEIYNLTSKLIGHRCSPWIADVFPVIGNECPTSCADRIQMANCSAMGFTNFFTIIGYVGQRYLTGDARYWLVTYINRTCLVTGTCSFTTEIDGNVTENCANGPLSPFFATDYMINISNVNQTSLQDRCFYVSAFLGWEGLFFTIFAVALFVGFVLLLFVFIRFIISIFCVPPWAWLNLGWGSGGGGASGTGGVASY